MINYAHSQLTVGVKVDAIKCSKVGTCTAARSRLGKRRGVHRQVRKVFTES